MSFNFMTAVTICTDFGAPKNKFCQKSQRSSVVCYQVLEMTRVKGKGIFKGSVIFKRRDITLPTKLRVVKAMVFPVVMYGCESWTNKKAEC